MNLVEPKEIERNTYSASSLQDILNIVFFLQDRLEKPLWFRGQGVYYNLEPSILRLSKPISNWKGEKWTGNPPLKSSGNVYAFPNQFKMAEKFQKQSQHYYKKPPCSTYEWLCVMQHYGIPTSLLDWTVDPLIALFFATDISSKEIKKRLNDDFHEYGAEFWVISPISINESSMYKNQSRIFSSNDNYVNHFIDNIESIYSPIAIEAPKIEERLILQKGCFTMHGGDIRPLNHFFHHQEKIMYKVEIKKDALLKIKKQLISFGYTHDYFYPNENSLYTHISQNEIDKFLSAYKTYCEDASMKEF